MTKDEIIDYDALWDSALKCRRGVGWKPSTKHFMINAVEEVHRMNEKLTNGTWVNSRPKPIQILYPKKRDGLSVSFRDRVYQRSINDNELYPKAVKSFITDNCACQVGKGPDFARKRIKKHLWNHFSHYGTEGYLIQIDIHGYYPNMRHDKVKEKFRKFLADDVYDMVCNVLDTQYVGDIGYNPGSQMVQIAGISLLDDLDHYIKERLRVKHYIRYMDDLWILLPTKETAEYSLSEITTKIVALGFELNEKKTHITPLSDGFTFLGFDYKITPTGKVIMTLVSANTKHERKKLYRLVAKAKRGETTKAKTDECFNAWKEHASHGNSWKLLKRMDEYYQDLWREPYEN